MVFSILSSLAACKIDQAKFAHVAPILARRSMRIQLGIGATKGDLAYRVRARGISVDFGLVRCARRIGAVHPLDELFLGIHGNFAQPFDVYVSAPVFLNAACFASLR